jgi:hypothetical protein
MAIFEMNYLKVSEYGILQACYVEVCWSSGVTLKGAPGLEGCPSDFYCLGSGISKVWI